MDQAPPPSPIDTPASQGGNNQTDRYGSPGAIARRTEVLAHLEELENILDYRFKDKTILEKALTHISAANDDEQSRLSLLGDDFLGMMLAALCYREPQRITTNLTPKSQEGALSIAKSQLRSENNLEDIAYNLNLMRFSIDTLSQKNLSQTHWYMTKLLKSIIGAVRVDMNNPPEAEKWCRKFILDHFPRKDYVIDAKSILDKWQGAVHATLLWKHLDLDDGGKLVWLKITNSKGDLLYETPDYLPSRGENLRRAEKQESERAVDELCRDPKLRSAIENMRKDKKPGLYRT